MRVVAKDLRNEFFSAMLEAELSVALRLTVRAFSTELARPTVSVRVRKRDACLAIPDVDAIELVKDLNSEFFSARVDATVRALVRDLKREFFSATPEDAPRESVRNLLTLLD